MEKYLLVSLASHAEHSSDKERNALFCDAGEIIFLRVC